MSKRTCEEEVEAPLVKRAKKGRTLRLRNTGAADVRRAMRFKDSVSDVVIQNCGVGKMLYDLPPTVRNLTVTGCDGWDESDPLGPFASLELKTLNLARNYLGSTLKRIDRLAKLGVLDLSYNRLKNLSVIGSGSEDLVELCLEGNDLRHVQNLELLPNLKRLNLSDNDLCCEGALKPLEDLRLEVLNLHRSDLWEGGAEALKYLAGMTSLKELSIPFSSTMIPLGLRPLKELNLQKLELHTYDGTRIPQESLQETKVILGLECIEIHVFQESPDLETIYLA